MSGTLAFSRNPFCPRKNELGNSGPPSRASSASSLLCPVVKERKDGCRLEGSDAYKLTQFLANYVSGKVGSVRLQIPSCIHCGEAPFALCAHGNSMFDCRHIFCFRYFVEI